MSATKTRATDTRTLAAEIEADARQLRAKLARFAELVEAEEEAGLLLRQDADDAARGARALAFTLDISTSVITSPVY